jgi:dolichyl-phosphate beta-glucosyltransferase
MQERIPARGREAGTFSLIFPTYNPGPALDRTWQQAADFLATAPESWEILFVCDGCTDGTPERLAQLCSQQRQRVRMLSYAPNRGKGYAVRRGLEVARGDWRLFTDVDLAYSFADVHHVAEALRAGADVAIASRTHPDSRIIMPASLQGYAYRRYLQSLTFSAVVRSLLPIRQRDTQAGLKGLTAHVAQRLLPHLRCEGFGFDCELLTACARCGIAVQEVPVSVRYEDRASTTSGLPMMRMLRELCQIRRTWRHAPSMAPIDNVREAA